MSILFNPLAALRSLVLHPFLQPLPQEESRLCPQASLLAMLEPLWIHLEDHLRPHLAESHRTVGTTNMTLSTMLNLGMVCLHPRFLPVVAQRYRLLFLRNSQ
jgi:hypothetical protein